MSDIASTHCSIGCHPHPIAQLVFVAVLLALLFLPLVGYGVVLYHRGESVFNAAPAEVRS